MRCWKVGIIGGGPGGLLTAYFLQNTANTPYRLTMFEASSRLGGKILTPTFDTRSARYEAGAAEFYDYSPVGEDPLKELIAELGLSINPLSGSAMVMEQRVLANLDDVHDHLGADVCASLLAFDRVAKDSISPREFYASDDHANALVAPPRQRFSNMLEQLHPLPARRYLEGMLHSDLATEPERTSGCYGLHNYLMNDPRYMHLYSIEGGNQQLPEALAQRIAANKLLNHVVTDVHRRANGQLTVTSSHRGEQQERTFDKLVVALPHNHLSSIRFHGEKLAAAMAAHHTHYNHPAHYLRMSLLFEIPFWNTHLDGSFCMLDCFGGCCVYDETSREPGATHGVLGWLLGGHAAQEMSQLDDTMLIEKAVQSLPASWGDGRRWLREGKVHRWINAINAIPGGLTPRSLDRRHQPEPEEHGNLFVVGDYLFDATLNGVLDSAEYVAEWIATQLNEP